MSRAERRQTARKRRRPRRGFLTFPLVLAALVAAGLTGVVLQRRQGEQTGRPPRGVEVLEITEKGHVPDPVDYERKPPAGGPHASVPQTCGFYTEPVGSENVVHSLEHGAVWITHRPGLPKDQIDKLRTFASQGHVIVSPFPGLPAPVVASAWARQIRLEGADDPRLEQFVRAFRFGRQAPEPGAACEGVGAPDQP